ncbi:sugar ABC transporter substrate-binding protein [Bacillus sp. UNC438CL73TsuS30]|uniref:sugar ABC transporter substrate-binding protein n=1 Tax=Bacillus sp. UNC438CL73TsuS30 TaxID=1340434 RepID=UPI000478D28B|nr:sugar ABC transporter substrate-binding protein [Bacillus sp. UNC438CL73TsuS30]
MKKLSGVFLTSVLGAGLILCGCGNSEASKSTTKSGSSGKKTVSVVLKALNSEYWKLVQQGAMDAGKKAGVTVDVMGPAAETEVEKQVSLIEDQITNGADALVIAPSQPATVLSALQQANDMPVIFADTDAAYPKKVSFVGTGNFVAGQNGGNFIANNLQKGDKVAIIRGALGDKTHDDRTNGAEKAIKAAGIDVVTVQPADSDRSKAMNVMENILQSNPDIKAVFVTSEDMALGALRAVQAKNSQVMVVGFDGTSEGLKSIKSGGLKAEVAQDPYKIGYLAVDAAVKALNGKTVDKRIDSGANVITKENADEVLSKINKIIEK